MKYMRSLTPQQTADYLEFANISKTINVGHSLIHIGTSAVGFDFVLVTNAFGEVMLTEGM